MSEAEASIRSFVERLSAKDWERFAELLSEDVERTGPYGDVVRGRAAYVDFLSAAVGRHSEYALRERRITVSSDGRRGFAEVTEALTVDGRPMEFPEVLAFDLDEAGRISTVAVYMIRPDPDAARSANRFFEKRTAAG